MDPNELSILVRALDGEWETLGSESARYRGIVPENVQFSADQWGSSTCSFELKRHPGALHPDLAAFTECEIWVAGFKCWSGRVKETPTREGVDPVISVQGQGWQYHLDDDLYKRTYVRTRLDGWTDMRSSLTANLGEAAAAASGQVSIDGSALTLTYPAGALFWVGTTVGAYLDMGPELHSRVKAVHAIAYSSNNTSGVQVYIRGSTLAPDNSDWVGSEDIVAGSPLTTVGAGPTAFTGTFVTPRRYLQLFLWFPSGTGAATGADHWVKFSDVFVFTDSAYNSGGASVLKADAIVKDAVSRATLKFSSDQSRISAGTFNIPEFEMSGNQTPREVITAANAFENYETKVDVERRVVYTPRSIAPIYEIGEWSGAEFEDASANSGEEIINRVIVEGTGAGGVPVRAERWQSGGETTDGVAQVSNPDADVDASGWTLISGNHANFFRDTAQFVTSPASFRSQGGTNAQYESGLVSMPFDRGERYAVSIWYKAATFNAVTTWMVSVLVDGVLRAQAYQATPLVGGYPDPNWHKITASWVQPTIGTNYTVRAYVHGGSWFDTVRAVRLQPTVVDRQHFVRTRVMPVQNRVTLASAERLGDLYLLQHKTTPFTGGFKATGVGGVRHVLGGTSVHPAWLAKDTGVLVRVGHVIDPDTGNVGRDERIAAVAYDHNSQTATVSLSEDRGGFDALLQRLAAVVK